MKDLNDAYVRGVINQALLGKITNGVAANGIGISVRYVKKLKTRLRANPSSSLSHGNKNRAPANKASKEGGRRFSPSTSRNTTASTSRCLEGR